MARLHLHELCADITAACLQVDEWILRESSHDVLRKSILERHARMKTGDPRSYLSEMKNALMWDIYFQDVLRGWDADQISAQQYNYTIERLSKNAMQLDQLLPQLKEELSRSEHVDVSRIILTNALDMQSCLNSFLNSADDGLNYWKHQGGMLEKSTLRQRRVIPSFNPAVEAKAGAATGPQSDIPDVSAVSKLSILLEEGFLSDRALLVLTCLVSLAACSLQFYSFVKTQQTNGRQYGSVHDADFLTNVQQSLMQLLTLFTSLVPALRTRALRKRYALWTWILSFSGCILSIVSAAIYPCFTNMSSLLSMFGNVIQAILVLQLVLRIEPLDAVEEVEKLK